MSHRYTYRNKQDLLQGLRRTYSPQKPPELRPPASQRGSGPVWSGLLCRNTGYCGCSEGWFFGRRLWLSYLPVMRAGMEVYEWYAPFTYPILYISSVRLNYRNNMLFFKNQGIVIFQIVDASLRQAQDKLGSAWHRYYLQIKGLKLPWALSLSKSRMISKKLFSGHYWLPSMSKNTGVNRFR